MEWIIFSLILIAVGVGAFYFGTKKAPAPVVTPAPKKQFGLGEIEAFLASVGDKADRGTMALVSHFSTHVLGYENKVVTDGENELADRAAKVERAQQAIQQFLAQIKGQEASINANETRSAEVTKVLDLFTEATEEPDEEASQ